MKDSTVQSHWLSNELPGRNCIVWPDGKVILMSIIRVEAPGNVIKYYASPICDTTVDSLEFYDDDIWTEIQRHPDTLSLSDGSVIVCGEGSMGNEGFIAREKGGKLVWALFTISSNPFIKLADDLSHILAYSTDGLCYKIAVDDPVDINIFEYSDN